jgi:putative pyruvate formate lyase activating enzyme
MHRQVGPLLLDEEGVALRGVLLRHLVMPADVAGSREIFAWIARELGSDTFVNVMSQYHPAGWVVRGRGFEEINRYITSAEFDQAIQDAADVGLNRFQAQAG